MDQDVYVIFGDTPSTDGSNIYGIYKNLDSAEQELELLELRKPWIEYHIEVFGLYG